MSQVIEMHKGKKLRTSSERPQASNNTPSAQLQVSWGNMKETFFCEYFALSRAIARTHEASHTNSWGMRSTSALRTRDCEARAGGRLKRHSQAIPVRTLRPLPVINSAGATSPRAPSFKGKQLRVIFLVDLGVKSVTCKLRKSL